MADRRLIPHLPDDLSVQCIARVPRSFHPYLALVSRSWRSLLRSPLLFTVRSDLATTEPFLYINIRTLNDQSRWYLLDRHHRRRFLHLPPPPIPTLGFACATLGPSLFVVGGSRDGFNTSVVQIFDPCLNRWAFAPRMGVARKFAAAGCLGGRIYVVGGCHPSSDSWAEVFDPGSGAWAPVPGPPPSLRKEWMHGSAVFGGKLFAVAHQEGMVFDPAAEAEAESPWGVMPAVLYFGWRGRAVVVDGILYLYDYLGKIRGYDPVTDEWRPVEGVERELPKFVFGAVLANLGGLLCLVWEVRGRHASKELEIECVGIDVARTSDGALRGSIAWSESALLAIPRGSSVGHCVTLEF